MKKFTFALERVLEWRRAQARREEIKLERLYAELSALDANQAALSGQRRQAEEEMRAHREMLGQELAALSTFREYIAAERGRIAQARLRCEQQIAVQAQILTGQRRNVKLLEKLKQQRLTAWSRDMDREIGQQAEESHLAKWNRENIQ